MRGNCTSYILKICHEMKKPFIYFLIFALLATNMTMLVFAQEGDLEIQDDLNIENNLGFEGDLEGWIRDENSQTDITAEEDEITNQNGMVWKIKPKGNKMAILTPSGPDGVFDHTVDSLGLSQDSQAYLLENFPNTTNFAYIHRDIELKKGQEFTMGWNYVATDYAPFNDASFASLVNVDNPTSIPIINEVYGEVGILGATVEGTGNYATGDYGSTGWQIATFKATSTGTHRLGFSIFNLDDTALSPFLFIDDGAGKTYLNGVEFDPIPPDDEAPPPPVHKSIIYDTSTFIESSLNDGSIETIANITLVEDTFTGNIDQEIEGVSFTNVPDGLIPYIKKTSSTTAELGFTGSAINHASIDNINNITVVFSNESFTSNDAESVLGATDNNLSIIFEDTIFTLTYNAGENGTIDGEKVQKIIEGENGSTVSALPDEHYHFVEWSDGIKTSSRTDTSINQDLHLIANFSINEYTVTFLDYDKKEIKKEIVEAGSKIAMPDNLTRSGYLFDGWYQNENLTDKFDFEKQIMSNTTLYANWIPLPVANDDIINTDEDVSIDVDVIRNDTDPENSTNLSIIATTDPRNGTIEINNDGSIKYTPNDNWNGVDEFTYTIKNNHGETDVANVEVTVNPINDKPTPPTEVYLTSSSPYNKEDIIRINWLGAMDVDGDPIFYEVDYYDGSNWNNIATDMPEKEINFNIPDIDTNKFMIRVKSNDGEHWSTDYLQSEVYIIDNQIPYISTALNTRDWDSRDIKTSIIFNDSTGIDRIYYEITENVNAPNIYEDFVDENVSNQEDIQSVSKTININQEGENYIHYKVVDLAGNEVKGYYGPYKLDQSIPDNLSIYTKVVGDSFIERALNTLTFGAFFKEEIEVKITAEDMISGIKQIWYQTDDHAPYESLEENWTKVDSTGEITFTLDKDFKGIIAATAIDQAENQAESVYTPVVIEDSTPILEVTPGDSMDWSKEEITFTVNASEINTTSGIKEVRYVTDKGEKGTLLPDEDGDEDVTNNQIAGKTFTITENGAYNVTVKVEDNAGNITSITKEVKIDTLKPDITIAPPEGFISGKWDDQELTFHFGKNTENPSKVKYQYSTDGIHWQDTSAKDSHTFTGNINDVYQFRSISESGIASPVSDKYSIKIQVTPPTLPEVEKTMDTWYTSNQVLSVTSPEEVKGLGIKTQYRIKIDDGSYSEWKSVKDGEIPITENGINTVEVRSINQFGNTKGSIERMVKLDKIEPKIVITGNPTGWTREDVTLNLKSITGASGVSTVTLNNKDITGKNIYKITENGVYSFVLTNGAGVSYTNKIIIDKIDRGVPVIAGAEDNDNYYFGRRIHFDIRQGELAFAKDNDKDIVNNNWIGTPGKHVIKVQDQAGNITKLAFAIKAIPYTAKNIKISNKSHLREIKKEFEDYRSNMPNQVANTFEKQFKDLEKRIENLELEVKNFKTLVQGLLNVNDIRIAEERDIEDIEGIYKKLTLEQKNMTASEKNVIDKLLGQVESLKNEAKEVEKKINSLPNVDELKKEDAVQVTDTYNHFNQLRSDQKVIISGEAKEKMEKVIIEMNKLLLLHEETQTSIEGIDGTSFDPDVYLVVERISEEGDGGETTNLAKEIIIMGQEAVKTNMKNKELVDLYDINLMKNNIKIQPDGKVKVKIKIPDAYKSRKGLDVVYISDSGQVTSMDATITEDGYLEFITDHFSYYGIVAQPVNQWWWLLVALVMLIGWGIARKRKKIH